MYYVNSQYIVYFNKNLIFPLKYKLINVRNIIVYKMV